MSSHYYYLLGVIAISIQITSAADRLAYVIDPKGSATCVKSPREYAYSNIIREVESSEVFLVTGTDGEWFKVDLPLSITGYIRSSSVKCFTAMDVLEEVRRIAEVYKSGGPHSAEKLQASLWDAANRIKALTQDSRAVALVLLTDVDAPIRDGENGEIYQELFASDACQQKYAYYIEQRRVANASYEPGPIASYFLQFGRNIRDGFANSMSSSGSSPVAPTAEAAPQKVPCSACSGRGGHSPGYKGALEFGANFQKCAACDGTGRVWVR